MTRGLLVPCALRSAFALAVILAGAGGCAHRGYVRGSDDPSVDEPAMSTGLDKDDIERTLEKLLNEMRESPVMLEWRTRAAQSDRQTVAIAPFINETSEHIDPQLDAMLGETETWLVNSGVVRVVSQERQAEMIRQVEGDRHPVFDPNHIPQYGKQLGVKFYVTGKIGAADERTRKARRVQYFIFMQVIDTETSEIRWQEKAYITKAFR
ncbi:MAG: penicillin-binding protein activator LpoB [Myxococcales bacterium]|nr:penicillin-binding protein activator LpoB [Myxococcales bacterium]